MHHESSESECQWLDEAIRELIRRASDYHSAMEHQGDSDSAAGQAPATVSSDVAQPAASPEQSPNEAPLKRHMTRRPARAPNCATVQTWIGQLAEGIRIAEDDFTEVVAHIMVCEACRAHFVRIQVGSGTKAADVPSAD